MGNRSEKRLRTNRRPFTLKLMIMLLWKIAAWVTSFIWAGIVVYFQVLVIRNLKEEIRELKKEIQGWDRYYDEIAIKRPGK